VTPTKLLLKAVGRAAGAQGNLVAGAMSLAASAATWNPLPLILWGLGSTGWIVFASTSKPFQKKILMDEHASLESGREKDHERLRENVQSALAYQPFRGWTRAGHLPDYVQQYRRLVGLRDRVAGILRERSEMESIAETGIENRLSYLLSAYLHFVRARITYLQIVANLRIQGEKRSDDTGGRPQPARGEAADLPPFPRIEERLSEIDRKIEDLTALARKEPVAAETRKWHVGILQKQRELLSEFQKRDQLVVAQLAAFVDMFEVVFTRVSGSEFKANEVVGYMGDIIEQVEETERFVEAIRPAMDAMLGRMDVTPLAQ